MVRTIDLKFELVLAGTLLCVGLTLLPIAIYWVGEVVVGPYEGGGIGGLLGAIWTALGEGRAEAWALVSSPYVVIQLLRAALALLRRPEGTATPPARAR